MSKVYIVKVQGWGDNEDEFYNFGVRSTKAKASALVEELLQGWEDDGNDRDDVVYDVEEAEFN
jgi:hypothetical protein